MADAYDTLDEQVLDVIKYPPIFSPEIEYFNDLDFNYNNLRNNLFKFLYRYKYDDNEYSATSPISKVSIPQKYYNVNGSENRNAEKNNVLLVKLIIYHFTTDFTEVFASKNNGNFYSFDKKYYFYNLQIQCTNTTGDNVFNILNIIKEDNSSGDIQVGMIIEFTTAQKLTYFGVGDDIDIFILSIDENNSKLTLSHSIITSTFGFQNYIQNSYIYSLFKNDKYYNLLSDKDAFLLYHNVPLLAKTQENLKEAGNSSYIAYGNFLEGYDIPNDYENGSETYPFPNIDIDIQYELAEDYRSFQNIQKSLSDYSGTYRFYLVILPSDLYIYSTVQISFEFSGSIINIISGTKIDSTWDEFLTSLVSQISNTGKFRFVYKLSDYPYYEPWDSGGTYAENYFVSFNNNIFKSKYSSSSALPPPPPSQTSNSRWEFVAAVSDLERILYMDQYSTPPGLENASTSIFDSKYSYKTLLGGSYRQIGIEYVDLQGRVTSVAANDKCKFYIPHLHERPHIYFEYYTKINIEINHPMPEYASFYRILLSEDLTYENFDFYFIRGFIHSSPDIYKSGNKYYVKINRMIEDFFESNQSSVIKSYNYQEGDRLRFLCWGSNTEFYQRIIKYDLDYEISGVDYVNASSSYKIDDAGSYILDDNGNKVRKDSSYLLILDEIDYDKISTYFYITVMLYRPSKEKENIKFFQIGETFLKTPDGQHAGNVQQQYYPYGIPAILNFDIGDLFMRSRYLGGADLLCFPVISKFASDFNSNIVNDFGKFNYQSDLGQIRKKDTLIHGGKYFEGTNINNLSYFDFNKEIILGNEKGEITFIKQDDYVAKVIQTNQITSIYIGVESIVNPDGNEDLKILTDKLIGTIRQLRDDNGITYWRSIATNGTHLYGYNNLKGKIIRVAYNGVEEISDIYKYSSYINSITKDFNDASIKDAIGVFDIKNSTYLLTLKYLSTTDYDLDYTLRLNENTKEVNFLDSTDSFSSLEVGMIIDSIYLPELTYIEKIDLQNKLIYLSSEPDLDGPATRDISVNILRKFILNTISFNEKLKRFKSRFSFYPEHLGNVNNELISFKNGELWRHEALFDNGNPIYNRFYDIDYETIISMCLTSEIGKIFEYLGMTVYSNIAINMKELGDIETINDDNLGNMISKLPESKFKRIEGKYNAALLRDANTPGFTNQNNALMNGRFLRGQSIKLNLRSDSNNNFVIFNLILYIKPSELSK